MLAFICCVFTAPRYRATLPRYATASRSFPSSCAEGGGRGESSGGSWDGGWRSDPGRQRGTGGVHGARGHCEEDQTERRPSQPERHMHGRKTLLQRGGCSASPGPPTARVKPRSAAVCCPAARNLPPVVPGAAHRPRQRRNERLRRGQEPERSGCEERRSDVSHGARGGGWLPAAGRTRLLLLRPGAPAGNQRLTLLCSPGGIRRRLLVAEDSDGT